MVITDLGVFTIDRKGGGGMTLIELAPGVTLDEIKRKDRGELQGRRQAETLKVTANCRHLRKRVTIAASLESFDPQRL